MAGRVEVLGRVLARRIVATTDMPAFLTEPKVKPTPTRAEALLAPLGRQRRDVPNLIQMPALLCH